MTEEGLDALIRRAHDGEVLGEGLFTQLVAAEGDPDRRSKLFAAQLLEEQTKLRIESLAADLGVGVEEQPEQRQSGQDAAEALGQLPWPEQMSAIAGATGGYRSLYLELRAAAPDPHHPGLGALIAHERALNAFAAAEARGEPGAIALLLDALDQSQRSRHDAFATP